MLAKYQGTTTEYAIRAFPLGGYVGFPDDDPESDIPLSDPDLMRNRPILDRAIVMSAGVIANLIFAYFLLVAQAGTIGFQDIDYQPGVKIPEIVSTEITAAEQAGIKAGDVILAVENRELNSGDEGIMTLRDKIQAAANQPLEFKIQRGEEIIFLSVTPEADSEGEGKIGVMLSPNGEIIRHKASNLLEAFTIASEEYQRITILTVKGFGQLIFNFKESAKQVAGPVAIVAVGAQLAQDNLGNLFQFAALISINLAIINILPLPALDGGQLAFLMLEGMLGKPLPTRLQDGIMQTGLVLLLGLGVFLIVRDTINLAVFSTILSIDSNYSNHHEG